MIGLAKPSWPILFVSNLSLYPETSLAKGCLVTMKDALEDFYGKIETPIWINIRIFLHLKKILFVPFSRL